MSARASERERDKREREEERRRGREGERVRGREGTRERRGNLNPKPHSRRDGRGDIS